MSAFERDGRRPSGDRDLVTPEPERAGAGPTTRRLLPRPSAALPPAASSAVGAALAVQRRAAAATIHAGEADVYGWGAPRATDPAPASQVTSSAARGVSGPPTSLPHQAAIQASFGHHDISGVGAHVGGDAAIAAKEIGASAYAMGDQVAFRSSPDLFLAAHEAAHVVQQRGGVQLSGGVGQSGDRYEQHADAVASLVVSGASAESLLDEHAVDASPTPGAPRVQKVDADNDGVEDRARVDAEVGQDICAGRGVSTSLDANLSGVNEGRYEEYATIAEKMTRIFEQRKAGLADLKTVIDRSDPPPWYESFIRTVAEEALDAATGGLATRLTAGITLTILRDAAKKFVQGSLKSAIDGLQPSGTDPRAAFITLQQQALDNADYLGRVRCEFRALQDEAPDATQYRTEVLAFLDNLEAAARGADTKTIQCKDGMSAWANYLARGQLGSADGATRVVPTDSVRCEETDGNVTERAVEPGLRTVAADRPSPVEEAFGHTPTCDGVTDEPQGVLHIHVQSDSDLSLKIVGAEMAGMNADLRAEFEGRRLDQIGISLWIEGDVVLHDGEDPRHVSITVDNAGNIRSDPECDAERIFNRDFVGRTLRDLDIEIE